MSKKICSEEECDEVVLCKGLCRRHYNAAYMREKYRPTDKGRAAVKRANKKYKKTKKAKDVNDAWRKKNLNRIALSRYIRLLHVNYGMTYEEYEELEKKQKGCCAVCSDKPERRKSGISGLDIDHCHRTGKVRGLLCKPCNILIGYIERNPKRTADRVYGYLDAS